jgi:hypothetical protein
VQNSIIALQIAGVDCAGDGTITSQGYNIESGTSCGFTGTDDQQNVTSGALKLGLLADNGGPTQTRALGAGSVAIDKVPNARCTAAPINGLDQRGAARNVDGDGVAGTGNECDIGAFEFPILNLKLNAASVAPTVTLSWNTLPVSEYQIWQSTSPHGGFALLQGGLTSPSFDVSIDPNINYYYEVRALDAPGGQPAAISNRTGVFSFGLVPGS